VGVCAASSSFGQADARQRASLDDVLSAYLAGDTAVVARTFTGPRVFQDRVRLTRPKELEHWLGSFDRGKAVLLVELARVAADVAPHYVVVFARAGGAYVGSSLGDHARSDEAGAFARTWHRAITGLLQGVGQGRQLEEYVDITAGIPPGRPVPPAPGNQDPRLVLARAIAQERRCWAARPSLDQPSQDLSAMTRAAGIRIEDDLALPSRALRERHAANHQACLREALAAFAPAMAHAETSSEARVRSGWLLYQADRPQDALAELDIAIPADAGELAYWQALFKGRILGALNRHEEAAASFRVALGIVPGAQSAGVGLAFELLRSGRAEEADSAARALRAQSGAASDPWLSYHQGDWRFVDRWIDELRRMSK
jgi:tetratricopeptide (TPR) repeat protein